MIRGFEGSSMHSVGLVLCIASLLCFAGTVAQKVFNAAPPVSELRSVSGYLESRVNVYRAPKTTGRAQLDLVTPEGKTCIVVRNVGFLWQPNEQHPIAELTPGAPLTVFTAPGERVAWEVRMNDVTLLSYADARKAERRVVRRMAMVGMSLLGLGALFLLGSLKKVQKYLA